MAGVKLQEACLRQLLGSGLTRRGAQLRAEAVMSFQAGLGLEPVVKSMKSRPLAAFSWSKEWRKSWIQVPCLEATTCQKLGERDMEMEWH